MKATLVSDGPVSWAILADSGFMGYSSGIYTNNCAEGMNHAVSAIGYGTNYVLALNSWGPGWGDGGRFKIAHCGVAAVTLFDFDITPNLPNPLVPGGEGGGGGGG